MHDRHPEQTVGALLGDDLALAGLEDRAVESIEATDQIGISSSRSRARPEYTVASSLTVMLRVGKPSPSRATRLGCQSAPR
jgi:hypothetical protein